MRAVTLVLRFALGLLALLAVACSTALPSVSAYDDDDELDASAPPPRPDAGRPIPDASRPMIPDASRPMIPDASRPMIPDASRPVPDAGPRLDAGFPRDAALPRESGIADAGPVRPDAAVVRDAALVPLDAASLADSGSVGCTIRNVGDCPATEAEATRCPSTVGVRVCAYPSSEDARQLVAHTCAPILGVSTDAVTRVQCTRNCFRDLYPSFEELAPHDCLSRPVIPCDQLITDQQTVDFALDQMVRECGFTTYRFGVILSPEGCARTLGGEQILDPAAKCVADRLAKVRFGCSLSCAIARSPTP
jgi:hypothetical protein